MFIFVGKDLTMQRLILSLFLLTAFIQLNAQQNHFIYIQTENKQPFYVKLDKQVYSSTTSGYLIISRLHNGSYNFEIGFPKSEWPAQHITCILDNKDVGYLLKDFGDKGWGLFNLQSAEIIMAEKGSNSHTGTSESRADDFSNMLSKVVNDPAIRQAYPVKDEPKVIREAIQPVPVIKDESIKTEPAINITPVKSVEPEVPVIKRYSINQDDAGVELVYVDVINGKVDTINILIPIEKIPVKLMNEKPTTIIPPDIKKEAPVKPEVKTSNEKFLDIEVPGTVKESEVKKAVEVGGIEKKEVQIVQEVKVRDSLAAPVKARRVLSNSNCKNNSTEEDFLKLRKKMASENNEDAMIGVAKKFFKLKCYTTDQVKNLSVLFLKDAGKYTFFDAIYPYVSDASIFSVLENQLTEAYYISRFRAMLIH